MLKKFDIFADAKQGLIDLKTMLSLNQFPPYSEMGRIVAAEKAIVNRFEELLSHKYVHFELPDNGARLIELIDGKITTDVIKDYIIGSHLPFERVSFEFELTEEMSKKSNIRAMVVLAHEQYIEGNVRAIVLHLISQMRDKENLGKAKYRTIGNAQPAYIINDEDYVLNNPDDAYGLFKSDGVTRAGTYEMKDAFTEAATIAIHTVIAALAALSCSNVKVEKGFPPSMTENKKRAKKGLIQHTQKNYITFSVESESQGPNPNKGSNAKKATHIRRGHIRRYQSGKKIWVEATVINGSGDKPSPKSYKLK